MAKVKVRTFTVVRDALGADVVTVEVPSPETVRQIFDVLSQKFGKTFRDSLWDPNTGEMAPFLMKLNEEIISSTFDMDKPVKDGDEVAVIFPLGGG